MEMEAGTVMLETGNWNRQILQELYTMRKQNVLCDIHLMGADGKSVPAHSCIVAAASSYLRNTMLKLFTDEGHAQGYIIQLPTISQPVLESILTFVYLGTFCISSWDFADLCEAAEYLLIKDLQQICVQIQHTNQLEKTRQRDELEYLRRVATEKVQLEKKLEELTGQAYKEQVFEMPLPPPYEITETTTHEQSQYTEHQYSYVNTEYSEEQTDSGYIVTEEYLDEESTANDGISIIKEEEAVDQGHHIIVARTRKGQEVILQVDQQNYIGPSTSQYQPQQTVVRATEVNEVNDIDGENVTENIDMVAEAQHTTQTGSVDKCSFICCFCQKDFGTLTLLNRHIAMHTSNFPFICSICSLQFKYRNSLQKHMIRHGEKNFICDFCNKKFHTVADLRIHRSIHNNTRPHRCNLCNKDFTQRSNLLSHKATVHKVFPGKTNVRRFECAHCGKGFLNRSQLNNHQKLHTRILTCTECEAVFRLKKDLREHMEKAHQVLAGRQQVLAREDKDQDYYCCSVCCKAFGMASRLKAHVEAVHDKVKRYFCHYPGCSYGVYWKSDLKNHVQYHETDKLSRRGSFKPIADEKKTFLCSQCNAVLFGISAYNQHLDLHAQSLPDGQPSNTNSTVKQPTIHQTDSNAETALTQRPKEVFLCSVCNAIVHTKEGLEKHLLTHQDNRPKFVCSTCGKEFYHKSHLNGHIMIKHAGVKRFQCKETNCSSSFYYFADITRHYKQKHKKDCPTIEELEIDERS